MNEHIKRIYTKLIIGSKLDGCKYYLKFRYGNGWWYRYDIGDGDRFTLIEDKEFFYIDKYGVK